MEESPIANRTGFALAIAALLGVLLALAALLDLGPCADELSAEEFIAQGDEICSEAHDEFLDLQDTSPRTPSEAAELTTELIEIAEEERDAISDLREPASLGSQVDAYLEARDKGIEVLRDGLTAAEDADAHAYEELQAKLAASQLDPRFEIARDIGFEVCSEPLVDRDELARHAEPPGPGGASAPPTVKNPPTGTP